MVVEGATPVAVVTRHIIGVLLDIDELGLSCWVLFTLAIYALPAFVGVTAPIHPIQVGGGPFGAIIVGFVVDSTTLVSGQCPVSVARFSIVRLVVGCYWRLLRHVPAP